MLATLKHDIGMSYSYRAFVSDMAVFVLKRDVKLQLTHSYRA